MAENSGEILHDLPPLIKVYKDGRVQRLKGTDFVPASTDPITGVHSKDVVIDPIAGVSARLFLPGTAVPGDKLTVLVYFHGGGFVIQSPFNQQYHKPLNFLVSKANVVAVSVHYRLAPEHPFPAALEDSWTAVKWVASESGRDEDWIKDYADLNRVYFGGDNAGANIAHNMGLRVGLEKLDGVNLIGIFLNCPLFSGEVPVGEEETEVETATSKSFWDKLWALVRPGLSSLDEPWVNPAEDENLVMLSCRKVLVYVAGLDFLKPRGWFYAAALKKSGWKGEVECVEVADEGHNFSVLSPEGDNGRAMLEKIAYFINDFPILIQHKDGRVERLFSRKVPASVDPETGVRSRDIVLVPEISLSARLYLPNDAVPTKRLPLLIYFHGGGFIMLSAFSSLHHTHLNLLVAEANVVAISVEYRLAPEHPLPAAYEDSWAALKWVASSESIKDDWISHFADLNRVFIGGDSAGAGANIAHHVALRAGVEKLAVPGIRLSGVFLNCPFFGGETPIGKEEQHPDKPKSFWDKMWRFAWAGATGLDNPRINPGTDQDLSRFGSKRLLVYIAGNDSLRDRGVFYKDAMIKSGWDGELEMVEAEGEDHTFSVISPASEKSIAMLRKVSQFTNLQ